MFDLIIDSSVYCRVVKEEQLWWIEKQSKGRVVQAHAWGRPAKSSFKLDLLKPGSLPQRHYKTMDARVDSWLYKYIYIFFALIEF